MKKRAMDIDYTKASHGDESFQRLNNSYKSIYLFISILSVVFLPIPFANIEIYLYFKVLMLCHLILNDSVSETLKGK